MTAQPTPVLLVDVDGTLIDSYPGIRESFIHGLTANGVDLPPEETIRGIPGPPMMDTLRGIGLDGELLDRVFTSYLDHQTSTGWLNATPFDGMAGLLDRWRDAGVRLSTATSKSEVSARRMLEKFGLFGRFDVFAAAQEDGERRSKAAVIRHALEQLGEPSATVAEGGPTSRDHILLVGDRIHDVEGAAQFGIRTVLVDWGYGAQDEHDRAWASVPDTAALGRLVDGWLRDPAAQGAQG